MTGILCAAFRPRSVVVTPGIDTSDFQALGTASGSTTAQATVYFETDGTCTFIANGGVIPATVRWWTVGTPPAAVWISHTNTGTGGFIGIAANTRYQLTTRRQLGNTAFAVGSYTRTFTLSFWNASTGGTLLGTRTFVANCIKT